MEDELIETLKVLGYPIRRQGSLQESEPYPNHFFTFWNNDTQDASFYDNQERACIWDFDLNFYSIDPEMTYTMLLEAKKLLKAKGWIIDGKGHDVASDEVTHTGRGMQIYKIESEE